ncbi:hypothetical protein N7532_009491 [Penicillium argentinense]|uniref:Uncharacterized protein n=1 Tax=Penicillium argentinense TaxID=1131581 RepID=A0A9W9EZJ3_9EURO|nr:uncharacterized protein N7532_009491 [Penicillium argentinense]KAJ5090807.1 hypothetical protein N7532_009491 [Penicillium argentinense]
MMEIHASTCWADFYALVGDDRNQGYASFIESLTGIEYHPNSTEWPRSSPAVAYIEVANSPR